MKKSTLQKLIQELCPDGVEFRKLGEVCIIKTGQAVNKVMIAQNKGQYPVINSGKDPLGYINIYNTEDDPIGITSRGAGVGSITWCLGKYFRGNLNYSVTIIDKNILKIRYLYFVLMNSEKEIKDLSVFNGIPALNVKSLITLQIPIPPLPVQGEIVRILDTFTELEANLEANLEAELEGRKKQYEYYRDHLLIFGDEVEGKTLGEVGTLIRGNGLQKKDFTETGVGCIHYGQIYTYYGTSANKTKSFVSPELAKKLKKAQKGDVLIAGVSENIEDVCKPLAWLGDEICISGDMFAFRHNQNTKFITYILQTTDFQKYKEKYAQGTKVTRVNSSKILNYKIPIPPPAEQERIVKILDKFDSLVNDLSIGIPAELKARRQQYEYYRNKLLSFKEKV